MLVRLVVLWGLAFALSSSMACPATPDPPGVPARGCGQARVGESFEYPVLVDVDGLERRYALHVPERYDQDRPYPVVLVFHGDADCKDFDDAAEFCLRSQEAALGTREAFGLEPLIGEDAILIYVEGRNLNAFAPEILSWDTFRAVGKNPDFAFVDVILDELEQHLCIDSTRTFAVGFSGGGFFADSLACLRGGLAGVATFEGGFEAGEPAVSFDVDNVVDLTACVSPAPAALVVQAQDDTVVPPRYGAAAAEHFRSVNGCAVDTARSDLDDNCVAFIGCRERADTILCTPASADPPRTHAIWQPQGPPAVSAFFQAHF